MLYNITNSVQSSATWRHGTWIAAVSWKMIVSPIFGFLMCKINGKLLRLVIKLARSVIS